MPPDSSPPADLSGSKGTQIGSRNIQINHFHGISAPGPTADAVGLDTPATSRHFPAADRPMRRNDVLERVKDLEKLNSSLETASSSSSPVIVTVTGLGGAGKTTFVRQWVAGVLDEGKVQLDDYLFIDLGGFSQGGKVDIPQALERLIRQIAPGAQSADAASDIDALVSQFHGLAALRSFLLIILDNALDEEHVRSLIPTAGRVLVVITSRKPLLHGLAIRDGFRLRNIEIGRLGHRDSFRLFAKSIGRIRTGDRAAAEEITRFCCGLPLAIRIAAALIQSAQYSMRELADKLREPDDRFILLYTGDEATDLSPVFMASYSRLSDEGQRAFRLLGLRPGQNIDDYAVARLAGTGIAEAALLLVDMHHVGLAEKTEGRFALHDLLHGFASHLAPEEGSEAWRAALSRAADGYYWCVNHEFDRRNENNPMLDAAYLRDYKHLARDGRNAVRSAADWFEAERANLVDLVERSCGARPPLKRAPMLAFSLFYFLEAGGYWAEWDTVNQEGYRAAEALGDIFSSARLKRNIARLEFARIRDRSEALRDVNEQGEQQAPAVRAQCRHVIRLLQESKRLYEQCPREQAQEVVTAYREIADVYLELARLDPAEAPRAVHAYQEAEDLYRQGRDPENPIASLNVSKSVAYRIAGDYDKAEECLRVALEYARQPNKDGHAKHPRILGYGWLRRAELNETRGNPQDYENAISCYDNAIKAFSQYANPLSEARTLARKGRLLARMSRSAEALAPMTRALEFLAGQYPDEAEVVRAWITQVPGDGSR